MPRSYSYFQLISMIKSAHSRVYLGDLIFIINEQWSRKELSSFQYSGLLKECADVATTL